MNSFDALKAQLDQLLDNHSDPSAPLHEDVKKSFRRIHQRIMNLKTSKASVKHYPWDTLLDQLNAYNFKETPIPFEPIISPSIDDEIDAWASELMRKADQFKNDYVSRRRRVYQGAPIKEPTFDYPF